jgi:hypothetical protein
VGQPARARTSPSCASGYLAEDARAGAASAPGQPPPSAPAVASG